MAKRSTSRRSGHEKEKEEMLLATVCNPRASYYVTKDTAGWSASKQEILLQNASSYSYHHIETVLYNNPACYVELVGVAVIVLGMLAVADASAAAVTALTKLRTHDDAGNSRLLLGQLLSQHVVLSSWVQFLGIQQVDDLLLGGLDLLLQLWDLDLEEGLLVGGKGLVRLLVLGLCQFLAKTARLSTDVIWDLAFG
eukprot:CAMPEP_0198108940 /NCGR_PEP_ID=MMETSP1442-20131203/961_1 /TAXON_ID= /ORGANISM="Craspedostauros australis, Strain CCMP3328" /LENGTH=195 /DNA_ID=CAMNT_0043764365 /DNA_START=268 /DNA_END=856 /DNA_ORIENTATION=+